MQMPLRPARLWEGSWRQSKQKKRRKRKKERKTRQRQAPDRIGSASSGFFLDNSGPASGESLKEFVQKTLS